MELRRHSSKVKIRVRFPVGVPKQNVTGLSPVRRTNKKCVEV